MSFNISGEKIDEPNLMENHQTFGIRPLAVTQYASVGK
jgi:hypothetical protein